jgi:N-acetylglutamate synthase-like GNAT family acetyltransferase
MPDQQPAVTVRRATPDDVPALYVVVHEAYLLYVPRIGRMPAPMTADYSAAVQSGQAWVAEADGAIAGLLVLVVYPDYLLIENIAVQPSAQRRGIGSRLLELAEDEARAHGLGEIRLLPEARLPGDAPGRGERLPPGVLQQAAVSYSSRRSKLTRPSVSTPASQMPAQARYCHGGAASARNGSP